MADPARIGYDDFVKHVLFPWTVEEPAHVEGGTPFDCAALAAHAALSDFVKRPGTILVTAADSPDDSRATLALIKAFFTDHQQLAPLLARTTVDGVELKGGTRIIVSHSSARRPKDLLRHIKLDRTAAIDARDIDWRNLARTILSIVSSEQREEGRPITERIRDCVGAVWGVLKTATITEPPEPEPSNEGAYVHSNEASEPPLPVLGEARAVPGHDGYFILLQREMSDGRQAWGIYDPWGIHHCVVIGEQADAEDAGRELAETGKITVK